MMEQILAAKDYQKAMQTPLFDDIEKILFVVRDADKLANLYHIKKENHLTKDFFYKQLSPKALNAGLSPKVKEQFLNKQTILFPTVYSFADRILMVLSWIFDLNYQTTKKIFYKQKYDLYLLKLLKDYHVKSEEIKDIKQLIMQNKKE